MKRLFVIKMFTGLSSSQISPGMETFIHNKYYCDQRFILQATRLKNLTIKGETVEG